MKRWIFLLLCLASPLAASDLIHPPKTTPLTLEHAATPDETAWGLMGRKKLPGGRGMTFTFSESNYQKFWAFNTAMDLSVAFLDEDKVIREIHTLKAYPDKMDPERPIRTQEDLALYPSHDPVVRFFREKGITSRMKTRYALEVPKNWFQRNGIAIGDVVHWNPEEERGFVLHTLDLSRINPASRTNLMFPEATPCAVWAPSAGWSLRVFFLDEEGKAFQEGLVGPPHSRRVIVANGRVHGIRVAII